MSSKSKAQHKEKEKPPVEVPVVEEKEIIPGKFYEQDWKTLLREDNELDFAVELVSEVTELAWTIVQDHLIEEQSFPHACDLATAKMLQIVEWHYLSRDEGERNTSQDPSWNEDTEPVPAHIDTWARGITPLSNDDLLVDQKPFDRLLYKSTSDLYPPPDDNKCTTEEEMTADIHTENTASEQAATDNVTTTTLVDSKPIYVAKTRKKLVARATPMVSVAIDSTSKPAVAPTVPPLKRQSDLDKQFLANSLKSLKYLPVKPIEVQYDKDGCIVGTVKLDPRKFPSHKIRPNYTVSQAEPAATRSLRKKPPLASRDSFRASHDAHRIPQSTNVTPVTSRYPDSMTLPSLVDTIDPVAGVTVLEGGRTRQGPKVIENSELESSYLSSLRPLCHVKPPNDRITSPGNHGYQLQT